MTDPRSPLTLGIINSNPVAYERLVVDGLASETALQFLSKVTPQQLLSVPVASQSDAQAMLAALWLWHDDLHESHAIVQKNETNPTHAFWHAILHRREGDFGNSKYWFARCRNHPVLATLAAQAPSFVNSLPADKSLLKLIMAGWSPEAFVDLVEQIQNKPDDSRRNIAVALQKLEWQTLFDHSTRAAAG
jgi:hypothetical protein